MGTTALVSVDEYLRRTEKPNAEYIDGVVHPKPISTTPHAWIQRALLLILSQQGKNALPELTVRLSPMKYLVPDVAVVADLQVPYPTDPAELCVEILSPEDRLGAMLAKCEQYHAWGVPFCWVIDPIKRVAWDYPLGGEPSRIDISGRLQAGDMVVSMEELFAQLKS